MSEASLYNPIIISDGRKSNGRIKTALRFHEKFSSLLCISPFHYGIFYAHATSHTIPRRPHKPQR